MIHIPNDRRAEESAHKIYQSVRHILKKKNLEDITVMDIKNESGISRSTFYRLFDNVTDVLEMQLGHFLDVYYEKVTEKEDKLLYFYEYFDRHSDLIYILTNQSEFILKKVFLKRIKAENDTLNDYLVSYKIGIITSLLCRWTERGKKEKPSEMALITRKLLSLNLSNVITDI